MNPDTQEGSNQFAEQLRRLLLAVEASGQAILPSSNDRLLQSIVEAAARIFDAAAASIALVDEVARAVFQGGAWRRVRKRDRDACTDEPGNCRVRRYDRAANCHLQRA